MREKLQTLPLTELKELAKSQGMKGLSGMKKSEIIDLLCQRAKEMETQKAEENNSEEVQSVESAAAGANRQVKQERGNRAKRPVKSGQQEQSEPADLAGPSEAPDRGAKPDRAVQAERGEQPVRTVLPDRTERPDRTVRSDGGDRTARGAQSDRGERPVRGAQSDRGERMDRGTQPERTDRAIQPDRQTIRREPVSQSSDIGFQEQASQEIAELDSGVEANGILEVMPDGFGFIRCENFLPGENDVYVAPSQIRRFNMKTGDIIVGSRRIKTAQEKFAALLYIRSVNGMPPSVLEKRPNFEDLTPVFPNERLHMETAGRVSSTAMRVLDLLAPIGKGQRGLIVSPPKAGKTTLLKQVAQAITTNNPDMHLIILLIDERPEEVTDVKESVFGKNVEIIYSTFDELPERHKRVSEMVVERARRLVEHGRDVTILLDSITRLARAYNLVVPPSGRTLSGGLDPAALHMPKRFFGAARNMREGGSLTILATALVDTGSRMDDVIYEEFKSTGNMELVLDRKLSEKRIFPAIDILKSGTRNDHLLLAAEEKECVDTLRKATNSLKQDEAVEQILNLFARTRNNREFIENAKRTRFF